MLFMVVMTRIWQMFVPLAVTFLLVLLSRETETVPVCFSASHTVHCDVIFFILLHIRWHLWLFILHYTNACIDWLIDLMFVANRCGGYLLLVYCWFLLSVDLVNSFGAVEGKASHEVPTTYCRLLWMVEASHKLSKHRMASCECDWLLMIVHSLLGWKTDVCYIALRLGVHVTCCVHCY